MLPTQNTSGALGCFSHWSKVFEWGELCRHSVEMAFKCVSKSYLIDLRSAFLLDFWEFMLVFSEVIFNPHEQENLGKLEKGTNLRNWNSET